MHYLSQYITCIHGIHMIEPTSYITTQTIIIHPWICKFFQTLIQPYRGNYFFKILRWITPIQLFFEFHTFNFNTVHTESNLVCSLTWNINNFTAIIYILYMWYKLVQVWRVEFLWGMIIRQYVSMIHVTIESKYLHPNMHYIFITSVPLC